MNYTVKFKENGVEKKVTFVYESPFFKKVHFSPCREEWPR